MALSGWNMSCIKIMFLIRRCVEGDISHMCIRKLNVYTEYEIMKIAEGAEERLPTFTDAGNHLQKHRCHNPEDHSHHHYHHENLEPQLAGRDYRIFPTFHS
jgi:hypothetical protein